MGPISNHHTQLKQNLSLLGKRRSFKHIHDTYGMKAHSGRSEERTSKLSPKEMEALKIKIRDEINLNRLRTKVAQGFLAIILILIVLGTVFILN